MSETPPDPGGFRPPSGDGRGDRIGSGLNRKRIVLILAGAVLLTILGLAARNWWREKRWRYIVIHHTASDMGNLEFYRRLHMARGWPDLAYHFLIDNGSYNTAVGQVEESSLWTKRSINYSTKVSWINYFGIAIVLVGNFERHPVPPLQMEALVNLVTRLALKYDIPADHIVGHREIWPTACPGKYLNMVDLRAQVEKNMEKEQREKGE